MANSFAKLGVTCIAAASLASCTKEYSYEDHKEYNVTYHGVSIINGVYANPVSFSAFDFKKGNEIGHHYGQDLTIAGTNGLVTEENLTAKVNVGEAISAKDEVIKFRQDPVNLTVDVSLKNASHDIVVINQGQRNERSYPVNRGDTIRYFCVLSQYYSDYDAAKAEIIQISREQQEHSNVLKYGFYKN